MAKSLKMGLVILICLAFLAMTTGCSNNGQTSADNQPLNLTFGASSTTSPFYVFYTAVAEGIHQVYPNYNITVQETGGSADNAKRIRDGTVDLAGCSMDSDMDSYNGTGVFKGSPNKDLRVLWYDHISVYQWVATKASKITDISQFDGQYCNPGGAGTSQETVTKDVMNLLDIHPKYFEGIQTVAADAFQNRQIVGIAKLGPPPDSFIQQLQASVPITLISLTDDQSNKILAAYPSFISCTVPANTYKDTGEFKSIGSMGGTQALSTKISQEVGYKLIKALMEGAKAVWTAAAPQEASADILGMTLQSRIPLNAGTVQYLVEKGRTVPKELIPPEYVPVK